MDKENFKCLLVKGEMICALSFINGLFGVMFCQRSGQECSPQERKYSIFDYTKNENALFVGNIRNDI